MHGDSDRARWEGCAGCGEKAVQNARAKRHIPGECSRRAQQLVALHSMIALDGGRAASEGARAEGHAKRRRNGVPGGGKCSQWRGRAADVGEGGCAFGRRSGQDWSSGCMRRRRTSGLGLGLGLEHGHRASRALDRERRGLTEVRCSEPKTVNGRRRWSCGFWKRASQVRSWFAARRRAGPPLTLASTATIVEGIRTMVQVVMQQLLSRPPLVPLDYCASASTTPPHPQGHTVPHR